MGLVGWLAVLVVAGLIGDVVLVCLIITAVFKGLYYLFGGPAVPEFRPGPYLKDLEDEEEK